VERNLQSGLGVGLDKTSDKDQDLTTGSQESAEAYEASTTTRRRFARNAVVGGAVLATLGNRAAWGQTECNEDPCLSANAWASFNMNGWTSYIGGTDEQACKLAKAEFIRDVADFPDDSSGRVCPGYNEPQGVFEVPDRNMRTRQELLRRWNETQ
jgi:hypothetical protein